MTDSHFVGQAYVTTTDNRMVIRTSHSHPKTQKPVLNAFLISYDHNRYPHINLQFAKEPNVTEQFLSKTEYLNLWRGPDNRTTLRQDVGASVLFQQVEAEKNAQELESVDEPQGVIYSIERVLHARQGAPRRMDHHCALLIRAAVQFYCTAEKVREEWREQEQEDLYDEYNKSLEQLVQVEEQDQEIEIQALRDQLSSGGATGQRT